MYKVGDKFEIMIGNEFVDENDNKLYRIKGFNSLVFDENGLNKLKKVMSESDILQLKDNAFHDGYKKAQCEAFNQGYDAGHKDGYKVGYMECEEKYKDYAKESIKTVKASELTVDTKVICWNDILDKRNRCFARLENGRLLAFMNGGTSWTMTATTAWEHMALEDGTIVLHE